jgi:hypothetical protein
VLIEGKGEILADFGEEQAKLARQAEPAEGEKQALAAYCHFWEYSMVFCLILGWFRPIHQV